MELEIRNRAYQGLQADLRRLSRNDVRNAHETNEPMPPPSVGLQSTGHQHFEEDAERARRKQARRERLERKERDDRRGNSTG